MNKMNIHDGDIYKEVYRIVSYRIWLHFKIG